MKNLLLCLISLVLFGCYFGSKEFAASPETVWQPTDDAIKSLKTIEEAPPSSPTTLPEKLDLAQAIDISLANNPTTKAAWLGAKSAAATKGEAYADFYPEIDFIETVQRYQNSIGGNIPPIRRTTESPRIELTYTLLDFGGRSATARAARAALFAANFQFNRTLHETIYNVERYYYTLYAAEAAVEASNLSFDDAKSNLDAANVNFQVGMKPKQDVLQAESNLQQANYELEAAKADVENARALLAEVLGLQVSESLKIVHPDFALALPVLEQNVTKLIEQALQNRPDLLALRSNALAKKAQKAVILSAALPQLVLRGSSDVVNVRNESGHEENFGVGVAVEVPLFSGFRSWYASRRVAADAEKAVEDAKAYELRVSSEVWSTYYSFLSARRKLEASGARLKASEEAYRVINDGYKNGINSFLDLLSAQKEFASARKVFVSSRAELAISLAAVSLALGDLPASIKST